MGVSVLGESPCNILFTILPAFLCEINYGFFFSQILRQFNMQRKSYRCSRR